MPISVDELLRARSELRRKHVRPQVDRMLAEMRRRGVVCEVIGSYARHSSIFDDGSDLDVLVESHPGLSEADVWGIAWDALDDVDVDLVFASILASEKVALMKEFANG